MEDAENEPFIKTVEVTLNNVPGDQVQEEATRNSDMTGYNRFLTNMGVSYSQFTNNISYTRFLDSTFYSVRIRFFYLIRCNSVKCVSNYSLVMQYICPSLEINFM